MHLKTWDYSPKNFLTLSTWENALLCKFHVRRKWTLSEIQLSQVTAVAARRFSEARRHLHIVTHHAVIHTVTHPELHTQTHSEPHRVTHHHLKVHSHEFPLRLQIIAILQCWYLVTITLPGGFLGLGDRAGISKRRCGICYMVFGTRYLIFILALDILLRSRFLNLGGRVNW